MTHEVTALVRDATEKTARVNTLGGAAGAKTEIANRLAQSLEDPAIKLEVLVRGVRTKRETNNPGMVYALGQFKENPDLNREAANFPRAISSLVGTLEGVTSTIGSFKDSLLQAGEATRSLRRINRRIAATLQTIIETNSQMDQWKKLLEGLNIDSGQSI